MASKIPTTRMKPLIPSKEQIRKVFANTSDISRLCSYLNIPRDKWNTDNAVEYFSQIREPRKVRRLIVYLDMIGDTNLADSMMVYAEPLADPSITPRYIIPVFEALTGDWEEIDSIPHARAKLFKEMLNVQDQRTESGKYYALYVPDPNWKELSCLLFRAGETDAVKLTIPHIPTIPDPSLTPKNIVKATHDIPLWESDDSYNCLDMPEWQHDEIVERFDGEKAKLELFTTWLDHHPCPTWDNVVYLLKELEDDERGREGAAHEVEETYLKVTPEMARQILDASLQDCSLPLGYLNALAVGLAQSGKTLSKNHIFKLGCDAKYSVSTGVCEAPIFAFRHVPWELFQKTFNKGSFDMLTYNDINQILGSKLHSGYIRGKVADVFHDILQTTSEGTNASYSSEGLATTDGSLASKAVISALCEASRVMLEAKTKAKGKRQWHRLPADELQVILFRDSGGQPQCHELLPALSDNVGLVLFFLKLNERLDAPCNNGLTDEEGNYFKEHCCSLLTNEQMLMQFMDTMMCKPLTHTEDIHTMYMVIGTHRDRIDECGETIAEKNKKLANLLLPTFKEMLIMNGSNIIFEVNAKDPDENDEKCFELIREKVSDLSVAIHVKTPMCLFMFLNDMKMYGEEHGKRVVGMKECQAIAGRLKMNRQGLEAALVHFNKMNLIMYVPSVLPDIVFIDSQMPMDSVKRIVHQSYRIGAGAISGLTESELQQWKEGVVTTEKLRGEEFFPCFIHGLFEVDDALKLFCSLYIAAPLCDGEYIMPIMLQTLSLYDMEQYLPSCNEHKYVAPLFIHFYKSHIANGIFCSTHTCMRSMYGWTTCCVMEHGKRVSACLFRNIVKLQHPSKPIEITFIHASNHFEVYLDSPPAYLRSVCPQLRDMLLTSVDNAATTFRFTNLERTLAFQCPCKPEEVHAATPNDDHSYLTCMITGKINRDGLSPAQRLWLGASTTADPLSPVSTHTRIDEKPSLPELLSFTTITGETIRIIDRVGVNYAKLGIILLDDDDESKVEVIKHNCHHVAENITRDIFKQWICGNGIYPVTWKTLIHTLNKINLTELSRCIEKYLLQ